MRNTRRSRRSRNRQQPPQKARGVLSPRVQRVGPEHFGIVSIDCAKARSKWMFCDFYGNVLIEPRVVEHKRTALDAATGLLRKTAQQRGIEDLVVAVERTGRYHVSVQQAFKAAGFEVRIVHPFATKQLRQPSDPGIKTDDTDLAAIYRAAVNGFALVEGALDEFWYELRLLIRHRRDLVRKSSTLCCQIREHLESALPGYAACFAGGLWKSNAALELARKLSSPEAFRQAGIKGLEDHLRNSQVRSQQRILTRVLQWATIAPTSHPGAQLHHQIFIALDDDRRRKAEQIKDLESSIASRLVATAYILLLSIPGINVVSAAEFAGEMGPISHYGNAKCITGRAGLYPSRYQSDDVDRPNGPLVRRSNRLLRSAIVTIADNLVCNNQHFRNLAARWKKIGKDPRHTRVKIAMRFSRIAYQLVAGKQVFRHPSGQPRSYVFKKLLDFYREHDIPLRQVMGDLDLLAQQVPKSEHAAEAAPLAAELQRMQRSLRGPQEIGTILPGVLAKLMPKEAKSTILEDKDPR